MLKNDDEDDDPVGMYALSLLLGEVNSLGSALITAAIPDDMSIAM